MLCLNNDTYKRKNKNPNKSSETSIFFSQYKLNTSVNKVEKGPKQFILSEVIVSE